VGDQFLQPNQLDEAARILLGGGIVAFPTDTVYGLAAHPDRPEAVQRLFVAKARPPEKAIPLLLADASDLALVAKELSDEAIALAAAFWPGALTIVVPRRVPVPDAPDTVGVRVPAMDIARALIRAAGGALAVTSANISGGENTVTAAEVAAQLGGRIDAILDGGRCPGGVASTVVDASVSPLRVLRRGSFPIERLREVAPVRDDGS
jgi:L-threonylcarbamoyladenylate synthase